MQKFENKRRTCFDILEMNPNEALTFQAIEKAYSAARKRREEEFKNDLPENSRNSFEEIERAFQDLLRIVELHSNEDQGEEESAVLSATFIPGFALEKQKVESAQKVENLSNVTYLRPTSLKEERVDSSLPVNSTKNEKIKPVEEETIKNLNKLLDESSFTSEKTLKLLREKNSIRLEDIAKKTKINARHLEALENNNYQYLPAAVYVKGFVIAYLNYFSISRKDIVDKIMEEYSKSIKQAS